ncbi:MAG TPA: inorganic phosphate transporter, partial [Candidatus Avirikenella pullistercoris]|nr:inorganic phosphate transporter [Candidatus Avirikenella pullistercoris]
MESIFTVIVVILAALAVSDLIVGVSNDATNFLNSAIGSKVAPRYVIMIVASAGILLGSFFSSGMMEVARSGVFFPSMFNFSEIMLLFLAVMFTDVILLDMFNTFGLPTSTTVSLVFELLGSAVAVAAVKIWSGAEHGLSEYINAGNAMGIISGILVSVVVAFVCGSFIMYLTRIIFSFRYAKAFRYWGALWCGIGLTAISYFAVFKGLKGTTLISPEVYAYLNGHIWTIVLMMCAAWTVIMAFFQHVCKVNILKITVLAGTFSLALAFAGNDLVNFIGVFMAGYDSYKIASATGDMTMMMGDLAKPVVADTLILLAAGIVMTITLWFSKRAQHVTETEVNLARQDAGAERFGSTSVSRAIVRSAVNFNKNLVKFIPQRVQGFVKSRFVPIDGELENKASFDLIRATVNLTVASLLISTATSLKLPLSTTYVTFMVAMGSSLADKAWGRESAVYRITGVLT